MAHVAGGGGGATKKSPFSLNPWFEKTVLPKFTTPLSPYTGIGGSLGAPKATQPVKVPSSVVYKNERAQRRSGGGVVPARKSPSATPAGSFGVGASAKVAAPIRVTESDRRAFERLEQQALRQRSAARAMQLAEERKAVQRIESVAQMLKESPHVWDLKTRLAGYGVEWEGLPSVLEVVSSEAFDPIGRPDHVRYVQKWINRNSYLRVKEDGVYGQETFEALVSIARVEEEKAISREVEVIQKELIDKGYLKDTGGKTPYQMVRELFSGEAGFRTKATLERAWSDWVESGGMPKTIGDYRRLYYEEQLERLGIALAPGFTVPTAIDAWIKLPDELEKAPAAADLDKVFKQYEDRRRQQALMAQAEMASKDRGFWADLGLGILNALAWPGEKVAQAVYTTMAYAGLVYADSEGNILPPPKDFEEARQMYKDWRENAPWYEQLILEAAVDPLNWVGIGVIGRAAKFARRGTRFVNFAEDVTPTTRIIMSADRVLGRLERINRARDIIVPTSKLVTSSSVKVMRQVARIPGPVGRSMDYLLNHGQLLTKSAKEAKEAVRERTDAFLKRNGGVKALWGSRTEELTGGGPRLRVEGVEVNRDDYLAYWNRVDPDLGAELREWLARSERQVALVMSRAMPEAVEYVRSAGSRLFYEQGDVVYTEAGLHLRSLLHAEAYNMAVDAFVAAGKGTYRDFAGSWFVIPRAEVLREFRLYFRAYQDLVEQVWLPAFDSIAKEADFGFEMAAERATRARELLARAYDEVVQVPNPNREWRMDFATPADREAYDRAVATIGEARREFQSLSARLGDLRLERARLLGSGQESLFGDRARRLAELQEEIAAGERRLSELDRLRSHELPDTPEGAWRALEAELSVTTEAIASSRSQIRRLTRKLENLEAVDREIAADFINELIDITRAQVRKWEEMRAYLRQVPPGPEVSRAQGRVERALEQAEGFLDALENGSLRAADDPAWANLTEEQLRAARRDKIQGALDEQRRIHDEMVEDYERLLDLQRGFQGTPRDFGGRPVSRRKMLQALQEERRMWHEHYEEVWRTAQAAGRRVPSPQEQATTLAEIDTALEAAWRHTPEGWVDTREFIEVPAMYAHNRPDMPAEWQDLGIAFTPAQKAEVRRMFAGFDVALGADQGFVPKVLPDEAGLELVESAERRVAEARAHLGSLESQGASAAERTAAHGEVLRAEEALERVKANTTRYRYAGSGTPLEEMPGMWNSQFLQRGREVEREFLGRAGRESDEALFIEALKDREACLDAVGKVIKPIVFRERGLYVKALEYHQYAPIRAAYRMVHAGTTVWRESTLIFRPAWVVANVVDNSVKVFLAGVRDPRVFVGKGGRTAFSVMMLHKLRPLVQWLDGVFDTDVLRGLDTAMATFVEADRGVLARVLALENIPIPAEVSEETLFRFITGRLPDDLGGFRGGMWAMMGGLPEETFRKALYRDTYKKALQAGKTVEEAMNEGIEQVNRVLFDYSNRTVLEENLRLLFPFIQFWRKSVAFWPEITLDHLWFFSTMDRYVEAMEAINEDKPSWMKRYLPTDVVGDWVSHVPGIGKWMANAFYDAGFDPINMFSFAPVYRAFKEENPLLTDSESGIAFIAKFIEAWDLYGLSMNPLFRKPLEFFGVAELELWRHAFPQTDLVQAFTMEFWHERFPNGFNPEGWLDDNLWTAMEWVFTRVGIPYHDRETMPEFKQRSFSEWVELEIAHQLERGEPVDLEAAQEKVRSFMAAQAVVGYFFRVYARMLTPEDVALYLAMEEAYASQFDSEVMARIYEEHPGYEAFRQYLRDKKYPVGPTDAAAFARWAEASAVFRAYNRVPFEKRQEFLRQHPEILPYVYAAINTVQPKSDFMRTTKMLMDTQGVMYCTDRLADVNYTLTYEDKERIIGLVRTPELEEWWAKNDPYRERVEREAKALMWRHYDQLMAAFTAIPATDYEARDAFLEETPLLQWWWNRFDKDVGKTAEKVGKMANRALREVYFAIQERAGWDEANVFLQCYPFIFEWTSSADKVSVDGRWVPKDMRGDVLARDIWRDWALRNPYEAVEAEFWQTYYSLPITERPEFLREFGVRYGHDFYTQAWGAQLAADALERVRQRGVRAGYKFLEDFDELRPLLLKYWSLRTDEQRERYLKDHPVIGRYLDQFKDGGWRWESTGRKTRSPRARAYLAVKDKLDHFFSLTDWVERTLYLELNEDVRRYLNAYGRRPEQMPPGVHKLMKEYFSLPAFSKARKQYLAAHPELQEYWNSRMDAEQSAIHDLLEVYFRLLPGRQRDLFLSMHPELLTWFDERKELKARLKQRRMEEDFKRLKWLRELYQYYAAVYFGEAETVRRQLMKERMDTVTFSRRITRQSRIPEKTSS